MTALTEFTHDDWRGNSAAPALQPLSWTKTGWQTPAHSLSRLYQYVLTAINFKIAGALALFRSERVYASPLSFAALIYTTVLWASLIDLDSVTRLMPEHVAQGVEVAAALWVIAAKRSLSRATVRPASGRGVVDSGAYKLVRHPIYAGRAILYGAFLMTNFNLQNLAVLVTVYGALIFRIVQEERFLLRDTAYRAYADKVPYRIIYGIV